MNQVSGSFWISARGLAAFSLIAAVSYFLFVEHRQHIIPALPYLILLSCPLMHFFMHSGHGHGNTHVNKKSNTGTGGPHAH